MSDGERETREGEIGRRQKDGTFSVMKGYSVPVTVQQGEWSHSDRRGLCRPNRELSVWVAAM